MGSDQPEPPAGYEARPRPAESISHEEASLLVSKAWDGVLTSEESYSLASHLRACPDCNAAAKNMLEFLARLDDASSKGPSASPPDEGREN